MCVLTCRKSTVIIYKKRRKSFASLNVETETLISSLSRLSELSFSHRPHFLLQLESRTNVTHRVTARPISLVSLINDLAELMHHNSTPSSVFTLSDLRE